jgi:hypothetical protein
LLWSFIVFLGGFMKKFLVCLSLGLSISSAMASLHSGEGIANGKVNRGGGNDPTSGGDMGGEYRLSGGDGSGGGKISGGEGFGGRSLLGGDMGGGGLKIKVVANNNI